MTGLLVDQLSAWFPFPRTGKALSGAEGGCVYKRCKKMPICVRMTMDLFLDQSVLLDIAFLQGRGDLDWGRLFDLFCSSGVPRAAISSFPPAPSGPHSRYRTLMALLIISTAEGMR